MKEQGNLKESEVAFVKGNGKLEGFLILSHYVSVFGINGKKAMSFKEKMASKHKVNAKKTAYDIVFWCLLIVAFMLPGYLFKDAMSEYSTIKFIFTAGVAGLLAVIITLFLIVEIFVRLTENLNNQAIDEKLEVFRRDVFLKKFNIDMSKNLKTQKNEIFLYLSWIKDFADNFSLLNRSSVGMALKRFQYLDDTEMDYEEKVNKMIVATTKTLLLDIKGNIDGGGSFLTFWQSEKEKQFERVKENSQMILMENIGRI